MRISIAASMAHRRQRSEFEPNRSFGEGWPMGSSVARDDSIRMRVEVTAVERDTGSCGLARDGLRGIGSFGAVREVSSGPASGQVRRIDAPDSRGRRDRVPWWWPERCPVGRAQRPSAARAARSSSAIAARSMPRGSPRRDSRPTRRAIAIGPHFIQTVRTGPSHPQVPIGPKYFGGPGPCRVGASSWAGGSARARRPRSSRQAESAGSSVA